MSAVRVVVTGGPCSGKTTLLGELARRGYATIPEAALMVIEELNETLGVQGQKDWRRAHLMDFQERVLDKQTALEAQALEDAPGQARVVFLDRGRLDGLAYCRHFGQRQPQALLRQAEITRYDHVFVLDTLDDFVDRSEEGRTSDYDTSVALGREIAETYRRYGHQPVAVSCAPVAARIDFILGAVGRL